MRLDDKARRDIQTRIAAGQTDTEIAEAVGCTPSNVGYHRRKGKVGSVGRPVALDEEGTERLKRLVSAGHTNDEIGALLGLAPRTVSKYRRRLGLAHDPGHGPVRPQAIILGLAGMPAATAGARLGVSRQRIEAIWSKEGINKSLRVQVRGEELPPAAPGIIALRRLLVEEALTRTDSDEEAAAAELGVSVAWLREFIADPWAEPTQIEVANA